MVKARAARGWFAPLSDAERMAAMEFNAEDREMIAVLRSVVERRGAAALTNRGMLVGLLRDHLPDRARAIRLLMTAYDGGVSDAFTERPTLEAGALERQARSLSDETGLREDVARWAVGIWAAALTPLASVPQPTTELRAVTPPGAGDEEASLASDVAVSLPAIPAAPPLAPVSAVAEFAVPVVADEPSPPPLKATVGGRLRGAAAPPEPAPARKRSRALLAVLGVGVTLAASVAVRLTLLRDRPPATSRPIIRTHGGGAATIVGATEDGATVVLASVSPDRSDWPIMPDAGHPDGDSHHWRFTTGIKFADGRVFYYQPTVALGADLSAGVADVRAGDLSAPPGPKPVSVSQFTPAIRDPAAADQLDVTFSDWRDDAADAPPICLKFTLDGAAATFEPQIFCVTAVVEGACTSRILGCGFFH